MNRREKLAKDLEVVEGIVDTFPPAWGRDKFKYRVLVRGGVLTGIEVKRKLSATTPKREGPPVEP